MMRWTEEQVDSYMEKQRMTVHVDNRNIATANCAPHVTQKRNQSIATRPQGKQNALQGQKQTKCEIEYGRMLQMEFPDAEVKPWGVTLKMANGHKYTPDYVVNGTGWMILVEVKQRGKNGFRQNSYQRAKVAFDQCRVEFHNFTWRWAEKQNGVWHENKY